MADQGSDLGRRIILPSSFTGSDRYMAQLFQDSMAIYEAFGQPSFFITFTANPGWEEIRSALDDGQQPNDRPDVITRIFSLKASSMRHEMKKGSSLWPYSGLRLHDRIPEAWPASHAFGSLGQ